MRFRDRILMAAGWTVGAYGIEMAIRLLSTLIMTRLLFPEAYGQIAVSSSLLIGLALISDFGVHVVIQRSPKGEDDNFLRSAWTFQFVRGIGLWIILACICGLVATPAIQALLKADSVFANPQFSLITTVLGLGLVFAGFESTALQLSARRLNQRPVFFVSLISQSCSVIVMIAWALLAPSVWALVGGSIAAAATRVILSHSIVPGPTMYPRWDRDHVREIVLFGRWLAVSSVGTFISGQSDQIILGLLLPGSSLGIYSISKLLVEAPLGVFNRLSASLIVPTLREVLQKQPTQIKSKYYQLRMPFDIFVPSIGGFLLSTGSLIVSALYDSRYSQAGIVLQILAMSLLTYPSLLFGSVFATAGEPKIAGVTSVLQAVSLIACLTVGYTLGGFIGAIWGIAAHKFLPSGVILVLASRRQWLSVAKELRCLLCFLLGIGLGQLAQAIAASINI